MWLGNITIMYWRLRLNDELEMASARVTDYTPETGAL
jgi:hypothetical protein